MSVARALLSSIAVLALLGCEPAQEQIVHIPEGDTAATATTGTTTTPEAAPQRNTVNVTLADFRIEMPESLPAGPTTFNITNSGSAEHNFEIEGEGIERELPQNLGAGQSGTLEVDLQPGTYRVYCPVGNHAGRGMEMQVTVTAGTQTSTAI